MTAPFIIFIDGFLSKGRCTYAALLVHLYRRRETGGSSLHSNKLFSFFTITPSQSVWNALFIGVSVVRVSVRVSVFTLTLTLIPSWISPAIVRSVSLRPQNEGQKNSRIAPMYTKYLTRIFLTFPFGANRFQTDLQAWPLAAAEIKIVMLAYCNLTYIYCPKESKCRPLAESVYNPSCPVKAQSWSKENQKKNQKTDPWKDSVASVQSVSVFWF